MSDENYVQSALEAGREIQRLSVSGKLDTLSPFVIMPNGTVYSLEYLAPVPSRLRSDVVVLDAKSFIDYVLHFHDERTFIFADEQKLTLTAVIDYHESATDPSWCEHVAKLTLQQTPAWTEWMAANKKKMAQVPFAEFLEDHLPDIADPPGAQILEVATTLEAKKNVNFSSAVKLTNGERQFIYEETVQGNAQKGTLKIPETFTLGIEPFLGADKYQVQARLRYSLESSHLLLRFELVRPEDIVRSAFGDVRTTVTTALKGEKILVLSGAHPSVSRILR